MAKALITGASSGIGEAFAQHLANLGYDLIVVARREERLQQLADSVAVNVEIITADLTQDSDLARVENVIQSHDDIAFLVNNAGFGSVGFFDQQSITKHSAMLDLHLKATLRLIHAIIPQMKAAQNGVIINVSSFGAFIPMPTSATYNATKAFLNSFSDALAFELKPHGIQVQVLCPGFTRTEIWDSAGYDNLPAVPSIAWLSSDDVVIASLAGVSRKQTRVTPGILYQIAWRVLQFPPFHYLLKLYLFRTQKQVGRTVAHGDNAS